MWEHARYLAAVGHEVTYVSAAYRGASKVETLDGINVVRIGGIHWLWLRTFLYYAGSGRGRFDVVVAEGFGGSRVPRLAPLYVREPIITEWHQVHRELFAVQYPMFLNPALNLLERFATWVSRKTLVRAGTDEVRQAFIELGFKAEKIFVLPVSIPDGWLTSSAAPPDRLPPGGERGVHTVLWLGKLRRYKCPDHAVRAMAEVLKTLPHARLILAIRQDDRRYERQLRDQVKDLSLEDQVEFRLNVSEAEKRELMRSVQVLVVPSAVEGFGVVVLEANACGVPVVASSGVPEGAVAGSVNGLRYPFGDVEALAQRIVELLTDDALYARLSRNAVVRANGYAWSHVEARFEQIVIAAAGHVQLDNVARS